MSPIARVRYQLCDADGSGCRAAQEIAGLGISHLDDIAVPNSGQWLLRAWLVDAAGNADPSHASQATLRYGMDPAAPPATPESPAPAPAPNNSQPALDAPLGIQSTDPQAPAQPLSLPLVYSPLTPALRVTSARYLRGELVLRGRTAPAAAGTLRITFRTAHRLVRRSARVRGGAFRLALKTTKPQRVTVAFSKTPLFSSQTVATRVR